ncbi:FAD-binding oxidoreductase [Streptomyces longwoodensis]|uniref:FAD-binding oxidoreductase n=1 Tax=Streptomyces longwoodensis TaxID=68231 RepID=UPI0037B517C1
MTTTSARRVSAALASEFQGRLLTPGDEDYDRQRTVWNAMVDRRPAVIAVCSSTRDVVRAVNAARAEGLPLSVRGGGHSVSGHALRDGGLAIDLSGMRRVTVHADRGRVDAEGGCLLADLDRATGPHGLVVPAGTVSETGLGGLALGGGTGWLTRSYGLTCDNIDSCEVVLADGRVVETCSVTRPNLFWALRGGGGNFGVVTRFTLRAHRFGPDMRVAVSLYRPEEAPEALAAYSALAPGLPRTIGWHASLKKRLPPYPFVPADRVGEPGLLLIAMWLGEADDPAATRLRHLTRVGTPYAQEDVVLPFVDGVQRLMDAEFPDGRRYYTKETHLRALEPEAVAEITHFWSDMPMDGEIVFLLLGGALRDVPEGESAFSRRGSPWWLQLLLHWQDPRCDRLYAQQAREAVGRLGASRAPGAYLNMRNADEDGDVRTLVEAYGGPGKYARLRAVKALYDPDNVFRTNWNIAPAGPGGRAGDGSDPA